MCKKTILSNKSDSQETEYSSELYAACKYMVNHPEEFKDFEIYKDLSMDTDAYGNRPDPGNLRSRLTAQYNFLIGKAVYDFDENSVQGSDIMPSLDTKSLAPKDLAKILAIVHHEVNKDEIRNNLKKELVDINVEKSISLMDYLVSKIKPGDSFENLYNRMYGLNIRALKDEALFRIQSCYTEEPWDCYEIRVECFEEELMDWERNFKEGFPFDICSLLLVCWLYIDLCCYAILQFVIYGIMRNPRNQHKLEAIKELNKEILKLIDKEKVEKTKIILEGTPEEVMFQVYSYYYIKDHFLQDISMLKHIEKTGKERKNPAPEYSLIRFYPENGKIDWSKIQELFLEGGEKETLKSFKHNFLNCYKGILEFNRDAGRATPPDPISLRAYYREIYNDKTKYRTKDKIKYKVKNKTKYKIKQGKTIFNSYLKDGKLGKSNYVFLDEKINIGIFREYGLVDEYYAKNELQENLYCLICYILAKLDPCDIADSFDRVLDCIENVMNEIYYKKYNDVDISTMLSKWTEDEKMELAKSKWNLKNIVSHQQNIVDHIDYQEIEKTLISFFELYHMQYPEGHV